MKTYATLFTLLLISLVSSAQHQLHMVAGNVLEVSKANYSEEEKFLIYVNAEGTYSDYIRLWTVKKLVMADGTERTFEEYDKAFDIENHKYREVYITHTEPTNSALTLVDANRGEFMNVSEKKCIDPTKEVGISARRQPSLC